MRVALVQLCSGDDPAANLVDTEQLFREAAAGGPELVLTPECINIVSGSRARQRAVLAAEAEDPTLARLREVTAELGVWLLIGSLCLKTGEPDGRFANRSFLIGPDGRIAARYDKIHLFDVNLPSGETYRESNTVQPGDDAVVANLPWGRIGLSVCYDLRFPQLYRTLAKAGAEILAVPSAFTETTGKAHWHVLLRARAIENACFVMAPAQGGEHSNGRRTYGHSLIVGPWGEVLAEGGTDPGIIAAELDFGDIAAARGKVPALNHDRPYSPPGT
jgi:predicted amidohydrolase